MLLTAAGDLTEVAAEAAPTPALAGGMRISAHPYGIKAGWAANDNASGTQGWHWFGVWAIPRTATSAAIRGSRATGTKSAPTPCLSSHSSFRQSPE